MTAVMTTLMPFNEEIRKGKKGKEIDLYSAYCQYLDH